MKGKSLDQPSAVKFKFSFSHLTSHIEASKKAALKKIFPTAQSIGVHSTDTKIRMQDTRLYNRA